MAYCLDQNFEISINLFINARLLHNNMFAKLTGVNEYTHKTFVFSSLQTTNNCALIHSRDQIYILCKKNLQIPKPVKMMNSTKTNPQTVSKYRAAANSMTRQYFEHIKYNVW